MQKTRRQFGNALAVGAIGTAAAAFSAVSKTVAQQMEVQEIEIFPEGQIGLIRPELHGQFVEHLGTCIYGGLWVGKNSTIPNVNGYRQAAIEYLRPLGVFDRGVAALHNLKWLPLCGFLLGVSVPCLAVSGPVAGLVWG